MTDDSLKVHYEPPGTGGPEDVGKGGEGKAEGPGRVVRGLRATFAIAAAGLLPFLFLVRGSVLAYGRWGMGAWLSLAVGAGATVLFLGLLTYLALRRFGGKLRSSRLALRGGVLLVGAYCVYALLYLSAGQAKTPELRSAWASLHPVLRVAVSTVLLADREAVITDLGRVPADYRAWGLPVNEGSLHLRQVDGWVHAVDLRTRDRPEWRNRIAAVSFRVLGFRTLRHVGTADHLHVSLPLPVSGSGS